MIFLRIKNLSKYMLVVAVTCVTLCSGACGNKEKPVEFSSESWKNSESFMRYLMLDDLQKNTELIGMNASDVHDILGKYDYGYDPDSDPDNSNYYWAYYIREDKLEGIEVLLIRFEEDTVTEYDKEWLSNI